MVSKDVNQDEGVLMDEDKILDKLEKLGVFMVYRLSKKQSLYYGKTFFIPEFYCYTFSGNVQYTLVHEDALTAEQRQNSYAAAYDNEMWFINSDSQVVAADGYTYVLAFTDKRHAQYISDLFLQQMAETDFERSDEVHSLYLRLYRKVKSLLGKHHERLQ